MIPIDVSALQNWPDPDAITASADRIASLGKAFHEHLETGHSRWQGLAACYETPHQERMYSALDPALEDGANVKEACGNIKSAMIVFAESIRALIPERDSLISQAQGYNSSPETPSIAPFNERSNFFSVEHRNITAGIESLAERYTAAINTCASALGATGEDGRITPGKPAINTFARDASISFTKEMATNLQAHGRIMTSQFAIQLNGHVYHLPYRIRLTHGDPLPWEAPIKENYLQRFRGNLRNKIIPPTYAPVAPYELTTESRIAAGPTGRHAKGPAWSIDRQHVHRAWLVKPSPYIARFGRATGALGTYFTWSDEYKKVDQRLKEEKPHLTEAQRESQAQKLATVRTASQAGVSSVLCLAIGTAIPGAGFAVGLVVSVGVGCLMNWDPLGNGVTVGDYIGDVGEAIWETGEEFVDWLTSDDDSGEAFVNALRQKQAEAQGFCLAVTKD